MNTLPAIPIVVRLNALAAAAVVTLAMLTAITTGAYSDGAAAQWARAAAAQPV